MADGHGADGLGAVDWPCGGVRGDLARKGERDAGGEANGTGAEGMGGADADGVLVD